MKAMETDADEYDDLLTDEHAVPAAHTQHKHVLLRPAVFCALFVLLVSLAVLAWHEPLSFSGVMYRRHWCGLPIAEGGNGCLYMQLH